MQNRKIYKEWINLNEEQRLFILEFKKNKIKNTINTEDLESLIDLKWIENLNNELLLTNKYNELKNSNIFPNFNIYNIRKKLKNGYISKSEALLKIEIARTIADQLENDIDSILDEVNNCEHDFVAVSANWRLCLFGRDALYSWISKCSKCKKEITVSTKNDEKRPSEFRDIKPSNRNRS